MSNPDSTVVQAGVTFTLVAPAAGCERGQLVDFLSSFGAADRVPS